MEPHVWNLSSRLLSSGSLVIISPSVDDTASYECTVTSDAGEDKRTVHLTVQGRTSLEVNRMTYASVFSQPFCTYLTLTLWASGRRGTKWLREWMCKQWNGNVWFSLVAVLVPPAIADEPTDFLVTRQAPAVMTCTASGVPVPSVHWTKNGIRLLPRGDGYRILSSGNKNMFYWLE